MRALCLFLLKLSPSKFREDFSDEVLDVISTRCIDEGRTFRFVVKELIGLILLAWSMRAPLPNLTPVLGGLALAAVLHTILYTIIGTLLRALGRLSGPLNQFSSRQGVEPVTLGFYAIFGILTLIPLFILATFRIRHARTQRSLKAL